MIDRGRPMIGLRRCLAGGLGLRAPKQLSRAANKLGADDGDSDDDDDDDDDDDSGDSGDDSGARDDSE